jgi:hypothetical protein
MGFAENLARTLPTCSEVPPKPKHGLIRRTSPWLLAGAGVFAATQSNAATISATDVFLALEETSVNDVGFSTAPNLFLGADDVIPNGFTTTGVATSSDGSIANHFLLNVSTTAFPNQISTGIAGDAIPYDGSNPSLLNPWTLTFTNPGYLTKVVQTPSSAGYSLPAFANSVTVTGGTTTPTIGWSGSGNGVFVQIIDKNQCDDGSPGSSGSACSGHGGWPNVIYSPGGLPATGSIVIPSGILNTKDSYAIEVSEAYTHDGSTDTVHHNEAAISRAIFDYTVSPTAPAVPINIPMINSSGVFNFNMAVIAGATTYIDPTIATGYIYQIGAGNPDFASVTLPTLPNQGSPYEIEWDGGLDTAFVSGGQTFDFSGGGVSEFDVTGIDVANGLSPTDPTAFVTALTFEGTGNFTGTMTPITASVPESPTWAMMLAGFAVLGFASYRASRKSVVVL